MRCAISRREFLGLAGASVLTLSCDSARAATSLASPSGTLQQDDVLLFQGDSITDAGRVRTDFSFNDAPALGQGYAFLIAADLLRDWSGASPRVFNRGVSGDRITDLMNRWTSDTISLSPTVLSILVGINDLEHDPESGRTAADYQRDYTNLLLKTKALLTGVGLIVLEPFLLATGAASPDWFARLDGYRSAARAAAQAVGATFVPLHDHLTMLADASSPEVWSVDGIHPTIAGHSEIAAVWHEKTGL